MTSKRQDIKLRQLEALVWVARLGSFHAAARHLSTSQPSVSNRIAELESTLGVTLFTRNSRKVEITPQGRQLLWYAEQINNTAQDMNEEANNLTFMEGMLRVGASFAIAISWLPRLTAQIDQRYPGIRIDLTVDVSAALTGLLAKGDLDIAFLVGPIATPNIVYNPLRMVEMTWIAGPSFQALPSQVTPSDLARLPIFTDSRGSQVHRSTVNWFRTAGLTPRRLFTCSAAYTRAQLAARGLGLTVMASNALQSFGLQDRLRPLASEPPLGNIEYGLAYPADTPHPVVSSILTLLRSELASDIDAWEP